jgi:glycosyltransferase involved in cell wall biosynthesis
MRRICDLSQAPERTRRDAFSHNFEENNVLISIVAPVYNEREVLPHFFDALSKVLSRLENPYEIIVVNDGSRDGTFELAQQYALDNERIKVISLSRNFGQQAAMTAGLDCARGEVVVVMDADLQDPPELLEQMLEKYNEGFDVVSCQRVSRAGETWFKRKTASAFYELMRRAIDSRIPPEVGDFRLYSRHAVDAICTFREQHRFMRGLVAWLGLREAFIPFHRPPRVAGETKYPLSKLFKLAWIAISSSSALPLKGCSYLGAILLFFGLLVSSAIPLAAMGWLPIWASTAGWVAFQFVLSGTQLVAVGLLGDYIGRVFEESKQRPLYIVSETCNIESSPRIQRSVWINRERENPDARDRQSESVRFPVRTTRRAA